MSEKPDLFAQAQALPVADRQKILLDLPELELHSYLKDLYTSMEPGYLVEITHGTHELGKDLVLIKHDNITTDVIGVVVKCGDIKSKTLGDVDGLAERVKLGSSKAGNAKLREIVSQVTQARAHPARLGAILQDARINKVIVILAGHLSGNAHERLRAEIGQDSQIYDITWLIEKFTDHYPQIFFDGKAVDFVREKIQQLETRNWLVKNAKHLSEYFVEPLVATMDTPRILDDTHINALLTQRRIPFSELKNIIGSRRRVILTGDPGSGKSAALAKLSIGVLNEVYSQASKAHHTQTKIGLPVFITAKELMSVQNANELLSMFCSDEQIRDRFKAEIMLVDGLDEVPSDIARQMIAKAQEISDQLACSLVITSRKIDVLKETLPGFEKLELLPFEFSQAMKLFEKLLQNEKALLTALRDGLEKIKSQIPIVPLSLLLLVELVQEHQEVPASITELYDRFIDMNLGKEDRKKGITVLFEYLVKKRFLAALAFDEFLEKKRLAIPRSDFDTFCTNYVQRYRLNQSSFIQEVKRSGVLDIQATVQFGHRSFLDYFAAYYLYDKRDEIEGLFDKIVRLYFDPTWADVAFFFIGLKRDINISTLDKLFAWDDDSLHC